MLVVDGKQVNDSTEIMSYLAANLSQARPPPPSSPASSSPGGGGLFGRWGASPPASASPSSSPAPSPEVDKWRGWVDSHLVHLLTANIYRTPSEAIQAFQYITDNGNFSWWSREASRWAGASAMYFVSKRLKKKYSIVDERPELYAAASWAGAGSGAG